MVTYTKLGRLEWAGHICRTDGSRTPRKILERKMYGNRAVCKQKNRCVDAVRPDARKRLGTAGWKRMALE